MTIMVPLDRLLIALELRRDEGGGSQSYKQACNHAIEAARTLAEEVNTDPVPPVQTVTRNNDVDRLVDQLRTSARQSEFGRNMAGTPQSCRRAADLLSKYGDVIHRLEVNRAGIINSLGYIAAENMLITAIKIYRSIYGAGLLEAKVVVLKARDESRRTHRHTNPLEQRVHELEQCLRRTRFLVSQAAANKGFGDEETVRELFTNNGAITRAVPLRPEDRAQTSEMMDKANL